MASSLTKAQLKNGKNGRSGNHGSKAHAPAPARSRRKNAASSSASTSGASGAGYEGYEDFDGLVARSGIRNTPQRRLVYEALMERHDHPTAQDIFLHVKAKVPSISLATVYNCLETLTGSGMIRHVNLDRAPSRYCQNPEPHGHFFCDTCGAVSDVPLKGSLEDLWELPKGTAVTHGEVNLRGLCADCGEADCTEDSTRS